MSDAPASNTAPEPSVAELDLAAQRAQLPLLDAEWNALDRNPETRGSDAQGDAAKRVRACGETIVRLERQLGLTDDYTNGQSHVKVGT